MVKEVLVKKKSEGKSANSEAKQTSDLVAQIKNDVETYNMICVSGLDLESIPPFIDYKIDFSHVTIFEAEGNNLSSIPVEINQLVSLVEMNFGKNNITWIPALMLPQLKTFDVAFNPLVELPDDLDVGLPKIELINCFDCKLRSLPIELLKRKSNLSIVANRNYLQIGYDHIPPEIVEQVQGTSDQHVPSEIIDDFLYIGSLSTAKNWEELQRRNIQHIVCMSPMYQLPFEGKVTYEVIKIEDTETANIRQHFATINQFISSVKDEGGRVLVHCAAGISRSPSAVLAYLMASQCMTYQEAKNFVLPRRPCICPNQGFEQQLLEYYEQLQLFAEKQEII